MEKVDVFMPLFIADYLKDTLELSAEEDGVYLRLLMALWVRGGRLPFDHVRLARISRVPGDAWERVWPALAGFFDVAEGFITQKRLALEIEAARTRKQAASDAGRRGAEAKRAKAGLTPRPQGTLQATLAATLQGTLAATHPADGQRNASSSSSSSPADPDPPPTPARDPSAPEVVHPAPAERESYAKPGLTAHWLLEAFARVRADHLPGTLPWQTPGMNSREKAQVLVDQLPDTVSQAEVERTLGLYFEDAKESQDPRELETAFGFGTWVGRFHDLLEQARGLRPARKAAARVQPARASPAALHVGLAKPSGTYRKGTPF